MLAKIQSIFRTQHVANPQQLQQAFDHSNIPLKDAAQCPFMAKQQSNAPQKCSKEEMPKKSADVDSESEEEKPAGACPFMGTAEKKKNPGLGVNLEGFDEPFVSKYKYYLSASKINFDAMGKLKPAASSREVFDSYPIYLQQTLFYQGSDFAKVRSIECCSRFMAYEQLREKGNRHFNKGRFQEALEFYERAMSLFRWLEYKDTVESSMADSRSVDLDSISEKSDLSKVKIPLKEEAEQIDNGFKELREKYKEFFITYNDQNVIYHNGEEMDETADIDMRKSLLLQVYLNMAAAYMHLNHFFLARRVSEDALKLSDKVSQTNLRKAQSILCKKDASLEQLQEARGLMKRALEMRPNEKIFTTANENILKMLNLHDAAAVYAECLRKIEERINKERGRLQEVKSRVYERVKQIHEIEQQMIKAGKQPRQTLIEGSFMETTEMRILVRMRGKYVKVVEFYKEAKNKEQVGLAKRDLQHVLSILAQINLLRSVQIQENNEELGGLQSQKIQRRVQTVKSKFAEDIYQSGKYNFTMLEWAIKEIIKEDQDRLKMQAKNQTGNIEATLPKITSKSSFGKLSYCLAAVPLVVVVLGFFVV